MTTMGWGCPSRPGLARGAKDGPDTAEVGERGFGAEPVGAGHLKHLHFLLVEVPLTRP